MIYIYRPLLRPKKYIPSRILPRHYTNTETRARAPTRGSVRCLRQVLIISVLTNLAMASLDETAASESPQYLT
jgi:hypothetical protein